MFNNEDSNSHDPTLHHSIVKVRLCFDCAVYYAAEEFIVAVKPELKMFYFIKTKLNSAQCMFGLDFNDKLSLKNSTVLLCLYLADPVTFLASNSVLTACLFSFEKKKKKRQRVRKRKTSTYS